MYICNFRGTQENKVYAMSNIKSQETVNLWLIYNVKHKFIVVEQTKSEEKKPSKILKDK